MQPSIEADGLLKWVTTVLAMVVAVQGLRGDVSAQEGPPLPDLFGVAVAAMGDVNGDDIPDLAIGDPKASGGGKVWLVSAKDLYVLRVLSSSEPGFGYGLLGPIALNGDEYGDIVVVSLGSYGEVTVSGYAGDDGALLFKTELEYGYYPPDHDRWRVVPSVANCGDVDADGSQDVVLGLPKSHGARGSVVTISGATGDVLWRLEPVDGLKELGRSVAGLWDVNGDGVGDVGVGALPRISETPEDGLRVVLPEESPDLLILDGITGESLRELSDPASGNTGARMAVIRDLNSDGTPELLASSGISRDRQWGVSAFSGETLQALRRWHTGEGRWFGQVLCVLGDCNGDGVEDFVSGYPRRLVGEEASVFLFSGAEDRVLGEVRAKDPVGVSMFGVALARIGDLDGDEVDDLVIGGASDRSWGVKGCVALVSGASCEVVQQIQRSDLRRD